MGRGSAAALATALRYPRVVRAVVTTVDLGNPIAGLHTLAAPTLFIAGLQDPGHFEWGRWLQRQLRITSALECVPGSVRQSPDADTLGALIALATRWFVGYLHPRATSGSRLRR